MPEYIFETICLDILRLHQNICSITLATEFNGGTEIIKAPYANINEKYYALLPITFETSSLSSGIMLIEDKKANSRIMWIVNTRKVCKKENLYIKASAILERRIDRSKINSSSFTEKCLFEITPKQGRVSLEKSREYMLAPADLEKALSPQKILNDVMVF